MLDRDHVDFGLQQFDKLLLTFLVVFFTYIAVHENHISHGQASQAALAVIALAVDHSKLFAGALLTLITGRALARGGDSRGGSGGSNGYSGQTISTSAEAKK